MMNRSIKYMKFMEKVWLVLTIVGVVFATYQCVTISWDAYAISFVIPGISGFAYLTRRFLRKRIERNHNDGSNGKSN